jgi:outer membrane immunogenic protein
MKKRAVTAIVALCLTPAASVAADQPMASPQLYPAPFIPRQAVEWTGLYFGANAGYGWSQQSATTLFEGDLQGGTTTLRGLGATELSGTTVLGSGALDGAIAGGQIGFNWQAGMAVFGAELDAQWSGQQRAFAANCGAAVPLPNRYGLGRSSLAAPESVWHSTGSCRTSPPERRWSTPATS